MAEYASIVVAAIAAVGTAVSTYSMYRQGQAQSQAARYNAKLAAQQAATLEAAGAAQSEAARERGRRELASNRAAVASSGVEMGVGSPLMVAADNARQAELNALMEGYGARTQAAGLRAEIPLLKSQAREAALMGGLRGAGTLLSGAVDIGSRGYGASRSQPLLNEADALADYMGGPSPSSSWSSWGWGGPTRTRGHH